MTEPTPTYNAGLVTAVTDPHLLDLLELQRIAGGTETEAYAWPKLMTRLSAMIRLRQGELDWQQRRGPVGAPTGGA